jgi:hypothetical protein
MARETGRPLLPRDRHRALQRIYAEIDRLVKTKVQVRRYVRFTERYLPFLLASAPRSSPWSGASAPPAGGGCHDGLAHPELLHLIALLPAVAGLAMLLWGRRRRQAAEALGDPALVRRLSTGDLGGVPTGAWCW